VTPSRSARVSLLAAAGLAGSGVMTVELAAVRLLAPHFGSSTSVWTNVIGVVLLALALGYALGARWSALADAAQRLWVVLVSAAAWIALLPFATPALAELFLPERLELHDALELVQWGSLATAMIAFAPPIAVLGAAGPLVVELVQRGGVARAGAAGGQVLGASTLGSLVGTFATTHGLVPGLGLRMTFFVAAVLLVAAALLVRRSVLRNVLVVAGLVALAWLPAREPGVGAGRELVDWLESPYQQVRVSRSTGDGEQLWYLEVGEASDSFQSVRQVQPGLLPEGFYYNDFVLPLWWDAALAGREVRVLVVGLGGGTAFEVLRGAAPVGTRIRAVGVEIDPGVVALARKHLGLEHADLEVVAGADARVALRHVEGQFDLVVVDAYANQFQIPEHLATREFFTDLARHVAPGGWIASNVSGFGHDDPVVEAVGGTLAAALGAPVLALRVPAARNTTLFARVGAPLVLPTEPGFVPNDERVARLVAQRVVDVNWRLIGPASDPLTDDHSRLGPLHDRALALAARRSRASLP
jgi:spermidine synthase